MIIGIDASRANKPNKTGTEWYSYHLIKNLSDIDRENEYRLYSQLPPDPGLTHLGPKFHHEQLNWPPKKLWSQLRLSGQMLVKPPDVLFIPAHTIPIIHPRTVTTCHDLGFERLPHLYSRSELLYQRWALRNAIKTTSKIICVSQFTADELMNLYKVPSEKIKVIHHGYNSELFRPVDSNQANRTAAKHNLNPGQYLIYIGRLEEKKNTLGLIQAFQKLTTQADFKEYQLALVGSPGNGWPKIEQYLKANEDLSKKVKILGWTPSEELPDLLSASAAFVFPTFYEGFGLPILEAMACETPVFASDIKPLREVGGEGVIYFDQSDPDKIAGVLSSGLKNRQSVVNQMKPIWQKNLAKFSWNKCARETLSILV